MVKGLYIEVSAYTHSHVIKLVSIDNADVSHMCVLNHLYPLPPIIDVLLNTLINHNKRSKMTTMKL